MIRKITIAIPVLVALVVPSSALANSSPETGADFYRMSSTQPALKAPAPGVLGNDLDPDGDHLISSLISHPTYGGLVHLRGDGSFRFLPSAGFSGVESFSYLARDGVSESTWGHVYITVTTPPVARDDDYAARTGHERTVGSPGVLANDDAAERARLLTPPGHGELVLSGDGSFAYTSDPGFVGTDSFDYRALVEGERPSGATATIRVKAHNRAPEAVDDDLITPEDTALTVDAPGLLANDHDADGDPLTVEVLGEPFGEFFDPASDGSFYYEPPANYDSPVSFEYRISDGLRWSEPATATISIPAVDDPPYGEADYFELRGASSISVSAPGVLANDYDEVESDLVFARLIQTTRKGTLTLRADGSFDYVRRPGAVGRDSFLYQVYDSGGASGDTILVDLFPHHA